MRDSLKSGGYRELLVSNLCGFIEVFFEWTSVYVINKVHLRSRALDRVGSFRWKCIWNRGVFFLNKMKFAHIRRTYLASCQVVMEIWTCFVFGVKGFLQNPFVYKVFSRDLYAFPMPAVCPTRGVQHSECHLIRMSVWRRACVQQKNYGFFVSGWKPRAEAFHWTSRRFFCIGSETQAEAFRWLI